MPAVTSRVKSLNQRTRNHPRDTFLEFSTHAPETLVLGLFLRILVIFGDLLEASIPMPETLYVGCGGFIVLPVWASRSGTKVTKVLWYTLGTAHDFLNESCCSLCYVYLHVELHPTIYQLLYSPSVSAYGWYYPLGLRTAGQCIVAAFLLVAAVIAWAGHLVHVAPTPR